MNVWRTAKGRKSVETRHHRRLDGISDEELLLLLGEAEPAEAVPALPVGGAMPAKEAVASWRSWTGRLTDATSIERPVAARRAAPEDTSRAQAILTLGGEPVIVSVRPEAAPPWVEPDRNRASFELARWMDAVQSDCLGPPDTASPGPSAEQPVVECGASQDGRTARANWPKTGPAAEPLSPTPRSDTATGPLVTRFEPQDGPGADQRRSYSKKHYPRTFVPRIATRRREQFRWRRLFVSAVLSSGIGCAMLLVFHWITG
jgi:hypothetical protein